MNCPWRPHLDAYADDSCAPEELAAVEAHLRECPACTAEVLARIQAKRAMRAAATRYAPSPEFRLRIEQQLRQKAKPKWSLFRPSSTSGNPWVPRFAISAAALVLIAACVAVSAVLWTRNTASEQSVAELIDLHVATLASSNPVDVVSTDRHTVKPWFQGKLPFAFNLPELQSTPYRLIGGRLAYFHHNPGAQLLFSSGRHQLSVFILEDKPDAALPINAKASREKGFAVESWNESGLRYVILGDSSPADIHALSELLRATARS